MTKELEYIENQISTVQEIIDSMNEKQQDIDISKVKTISIEEFIEIQNNSLEILHSIKSSLQRLEAIDNTNPSEALKELEMLHDCSTAMQELPSSNWVEYAENEAELDLKLYFGYENIKATLLKSQEQEKVLEIIKEKNVNIGLFVLCDSVKEYNKNYKGVRSLTQEEFELLKRYFDEEKD